MTGRMWPMGPPKTLAGAARRVRVRRVVALAAMLTVIAGLVGLRSTLATTPSQALQSSRLAAPVHPGSSSPTGQTPTAPPSAAPSSAPSSPKSPPKSAHRAVTGDAYDVSYGTVRVKVVWTGSRITDVRALSLPQGGRSSDISSYSAPLLRREVLSAQSARIDTVSGASYTSAGYARSVQSALDKRGR